MLQVQVVAPTPMTRSGLSALLAADHELAVLDPAADARTALETAPETGVVVSTFALPDSDAAQLCSWLRDRKPGCRMVVHDDQVTEARVRRVLSAGAHGLVAGHAEPELLRTAVHTAGQGLTFLDPDVMGIVVALATMGRPSPDPLGLTVRERRVMQLVVDGLANAEIAQSLGISIETVKTHLRRILPKLGAHTREHAVEIYTRYQED